MLGARISGVTWPAARISNFCVSVSPVVAATSGIWRSAQSAASPTSDSGTEKSIITSIGASSCRCTRTPIGPMPATSPASRPWWASSCSRPRSVDGEFRIGAGQSDDPLAHAAARTVHRDFDFFGHESSRECHAWLARRAASISERTVALSSTQRRLFNAAIATSPPISPKAQAAAPRTTASESPSARTSDGTAAGLR